MVDDPKGCAALARIGAFTLGLYTTGVLFITTFVSAFPIDINSSFVKNFLIIVNVSCIGLLFFHSGIILFSLGNAARIRRDAILAKSVKYFVGGAALVLIVPVLNLLVIFYMKREVDYGFFLSFFPEVIPYVCLAYLWFYKRARASILSWVVQYVKDHFGAPKALEIIIKHPKGRLMGTVFRAAFGEEADRKQAAAKLAFFKRYKARPEADKFDAEIQYLRKILDEEYVATSPDDDTPFRTREIKDGHCSHCGAPAPSPNARYCTGCGETFKGTW